MGDQPNSAKAVNWIITDLRDRTEEAGAMMMDNFLMDNYSNDLNCMLLEIWQNFS